MDWDNGLGEGGNGAVSDTEGRQEDSIRTEARKVDANFPPTEKLRDLWP
jgi:hypothetical protein